MRLIRLIKTVGILLTLMLLAGCGNANPATDAKSPTVPKSEQAAPSAPGGGSSASTGQGGGKSSESAPVAAPTLPGDVAALKAALGEQTPLHYKIVVADTPGGSDKTAYLDLMLGDKGYPGNNELLLVIFPNDNHDIRFAMGAFLFEKKVSVESMLAMVRSHYLPRASTGDPSGGLADLIRAINQQVK